MALIVAEFLLALAVAAVNIVFITAIIYLTNIEKKEN